jgi:hypothetical protein
MKEHPILFSTPMVQAILKGRKTQTRRVVKPQPPSKCKFIGARKFLATDKIGYYWSDGTHGNMQGFWPGIEKDLYCPYGQTGDQLWVRETTIRNNNSNTYWPVADGYVKTADYEKTIPSIHMPKTAARIWLEVEEVRVERLIDITQEDAIKEGIKIIEPDEAFFDYEFNGKNGSFASAKGSFMSLWCKINGNGSWDANPWVWVIKFKVLSTTGAANIHALQHSRIQALNHESN